jgi:hypothetical protein
MKQKYRNDADRESTSKLKFANQIPVVGKCDRFIALLYSVDIFEENSDLIVTGTFYFNGASISLTLCSMQQVTT